MTDSPLCYLAISSSLCGRHGTDQPYLHLTELLVSMQVGEGIQGQGVRETSRESSE